MYRILIVEDNDSRQDFFRDILSEYDLIFTTTSIGAIEFLEQKSFDLIFLDMDLDDGLGRGLEVARKLQETPNSSAEVIIHSMNIAASGEAQKNLPGAQQLSIAQMRHIMTKLGKGKLMERILGE